MPCVVPEALAFVSRCPPTVEVWALLCRPAWRDVFDEFVVGNYQAAKTYDETEQGLHVS